MKQTPAKERIEIWGDIVAVSDLTKSILISAVSTMVCYFLAPAENISLQLFFGLGGAILGFLVCTFLIKPKRIITVSRNNEPDTEEEK